MATLQRGVARVCALLLDPFAALPPLLGLTLISAVSGVLLLLGFRATSQPQAIRAARQRVQAHLLAIRLYREDLVVAFRAQRALLAGLVAYVGRMLPPFAALLLPFALLFAHLDARYAARALHPGEVVLVKARLAQPGTDQWQLEGSAGIAVDSAAVHVAARHEIDWRVRAVAPGRQAITLVNGTQRVAKEVWVAVAPQGAGPVRAVAGITALFTAPTEAPIDAAAGVQSIAVAYPPLALSVCGWHVHWIVVFLAVSTIVALLFRKRAGVAF
ncbi:MAG: hypothetical protein ACHQ9S_02530 [Candidatus Binatia bacterium]